KSHTTRSWCPPWQQELPAKCAREKKSNFPLKSRLKVGLVQQELERLAYHLLQVKAVYGPVVVFGPCLKCSQAGIAPAFRARIIREIVNCVRLYFAGRIFTLHGWLDSAIAFSGLTYTVSTSETCIRA